MPIISKRRRTGEVGRGALLTADFFSLVDDDAIRVRIAETGSLWRREPLFFRDVYGDGTAFLGALCAALTAFLHAGGRGVIVDLHSANRRGALNVLLRHRLCGSKSKLVGFLMTDDPVVGVVHALLKHYRPRSTAQQIHAMRTAELGHQSIGVIFRGRPVSARMAMRAKGWVLDFFAEHRRLLPKTAPAWLRDSRKAQLRARSQTAPLTMATL